MLTLAEYLKGEDIAPSTFAARLAKRLGKPVSQQNVYRWTRDPTHAEYSVPRPDLVAAIFLETGRKVPAEVWYRHLLKRPPRRRPVQPMSRVGR